MASSYSPLKIELIGTGEQAGTWGTTTNTNLGTALEEAITGRATATFPSDANYTLPYTDSNASQVFRNLVLNVTSSGNLSGTRDLIIPAIEKQYFVENNTSGSQSIRVKTAAGTGVTIPNGRIANIYCNGTDTRFADDYVSLDTVSFGTQTNKATLSYTTNAARTLTVPALGGNRTFAFLEEAQVYTADQTIGANLTFTGNSRRITGPMTSNTISERVMFQTSTSNGVTIVGAIPNGSGTESRLSLFNDTDTVNMESLDLRSTATAHIIRAGAASLGAYLPLTFWNSDVERMRIAGSGEIVFSGPSQRVQGNYIGYSSAATLFQTSNVNAGSSVGAIPNGTGNNAAFVVYNGTDPGNASAGGVYVDNDEVSFFSTQAGTGSYKTVYISNGGVARVQIDSNGSIGFNGLPDSNTSVSITGGGKTTTLSADGQVKFTNVYGNTVGATNRSLFIDSTGVIGGLSSTRESKANITPIENADWLMSLEPVSYNRRKKDAKGVYTSEINETTEFGLIADDVVSVRPEICIFANGKISGINYEQLIAPMLKEIQKLRAEIEALKQKG